jgi:hypothetical protein
MFKCRAAALERHTMRTNSNPDVIPSVPCREGAGFFASYTKQCGTKSYILLTNSKCTTQFNLQCKLSEEGVASGDSSTVHTFYRNNRIPQEIARTHTSRCTAPNDSPLCSACKIELNDDTVLHTQLERFLFYSNVQTMSSASAHFVALLRPSP